MSFKTRAEKLWRGGKCHPHFA